MRLVWSALEEMKHPQNMGTLHSLPISNLQKLHWSLRLQLYKRLLQALSFKLGISLQGNHIHYRPLTLVGQVDLHYSRHIACSSFPSKQFLKVSEPTSESHYHTKPDQNNMRSGTRSIRDALKCFIICVTTQLRAPC